MSRRVVILGMSVFLLVAMYGLAKQAALYTISQSQEKQHLVVIDVGHGGVDPGKVGVNQSLEKDINLQIALKLETFLQEADIEVVMTRREDQGLYDEDASNKKVQDMQRRVQLMEDSGAEIAVSIHQNSYQEASVQGPQCFYYRDSAKGKELAELLQEQLNEGLEISSARAAKQNDSYYLLKKSSIPTVIAECGFLSNPQEAALLGEEQYQEKLAWNLCMGILKYFNAE